MGQGLPIAFKQTYSLSTTETANLVDATYDYVGAGTLRVFAKGSDANVRLTVFINGQKVLVRSQIFAGTAGTLSTSDNLVVDVPTLGGRVEITAVATTGTPTIDLFATFEGAPFGGAISKLFGRR